MGDTDRPPEGPPEGIEVRDLNYLLDFSASLDLHVGFSYMDSASIFFQLELAA